MPTVQSELESQVLKLLENFQGPEPPKELFWSRLNYDRANKPIARRGWPEDTAALLHQDPLLFDTGGADDDFRVVYAVRLIQRFGRIDRIGTEFQSVYGLTSCRSWELRRISGYGSASKTALKRFKRPSAKTRPSWTRTNQLRGHVRHL